MKKIELSSVYIEGNTIHYQIREDAGLGLLQHEVVDLFIQYHGCETVDFKLDNIPNSILILPISLYLLPTTFFYDVELVLPEMDKVLYDRLPLIYEAYSKVYGPFKKEWKGSVSVRKVVDNKPVEKTTYEKVVFFSGGVDACHAGINNPGRKTLLVSIPDIESMAKNNGPLREEKFTLIRRFSEVVKSDWFLISNNFNQGLYKDQEIKRYLTNDIGLCSMAYKFDGWAGIKYMANMCCVAPLAYKFGVKSLIMGSSYEQIEDKIQLNYDGANPDITNAIGFVDISFSEQDGFLTRRSQKVKNIIEWCRPYGIKSKLWACFSDSSTQCGFCPKCIRTQMNILCAGENPKEWGFDNFDIKKYEKFVKAYRYRESNPCWLWDIIDAIESDKTYPYCNELLHWLKSIGYKEYISRAEEKANPTGLKRLVSFNQYPLYIKILFSKLFNRK